jgi:hypothetical protein
MPLSANPAARSALTYITCGALTDIWAGVWYWYLRSQPQGNIDTTWYYVVVGLLLSGAVLIVIGLLIGRIGRAARHADAPPPAPTAAAPTAAPQPTMQGNMPVVNNPQAVFPNGVPVAPAVGVPVAAVPAATAPPAVATRPPRA